MFLKNAVLIGTTVAALSIVGLVASATGATAYVYCNHEGDCWHSDARIRVPGVTFSFHPDDWYFHQHWDTDRDRHWREYHEGRGYWRNGVWVTL